MFRTGFCPSSAV